VVPIIQVVVTAAITVVMVAEDTQIQIHYQFPQGKHLTTQWVAVVVVALLVKLAAAPAVLQVLDQYRPRAAVGALVGHRVLLEPVVALSTAVKVVYTKVGQAARAALDLLAFRGQE
jgi:hypothetical protein